MDYLYYRYLTALDLSSPEMASRWFGYILSHITYEKEEDRDKVFDVLNNLNLVELSLIMQTIQTMAYEIKLTSLEYPISKLSIDPFQEDPTIFSNFKLEKTILDTIPDVTYYVRFDGNSNQYVLFANMYESDFFYLFNKFMLSMDRNKIIDYVVNIVGSAELADTLYPNLKDFADEVSE